jgi:hypothetical protein
MDAVECNDTSATIRYTLHAGFTPSRLDCEYAQGLFSAVPCMFGLPRAHVEHAECTSDGYPACVYRVTWTRRRRWYSVVGRRRADRIALAALHAQLEEFQQAAADLVSSSDIDEVLERIVGRAAAAILAPSYLLVVDGTGSSEPVVRYQRSRPRRRRRPHATPAPRRRPGRRRGRGRCRVDPPRARPARCALRPGVPAHGGRPVAPRGVRPPRGCCPRPPDRPGGQSPGGEPRDGAAHARPRARHVQRRGRRRGGRRERTAADRRVPRRHGAAVGPGPRSTRGRRCVRP